MRSYTLLVKDKRYQCHTAKHYQPLPSINSFQKPVFTEMAHVSYSLDTAVKRSDLIAYQVLLTLH